MSHLGHRKKQKSRIGTTSNEITGGGGGVGGGDGGLN